MAFKRKDVTYPAGQDNFSGIGIHVLIADYDKIASWPVFQSLADLESAVGEKSYKDLSIAIGDFVHASGNFFEKLYCTMEMGGTESDIQGMLDGKSFLNKITTKFPGNDDEIRGWASYWKNRNLILLVQELDQPNGEWLLYGDPKRPVKLEGFKMLNSPQLSGEKACEITFNYALDLPKKYTGAVITSAVPQIVSFTPSSGAVNAVVTVTGVNFTGATTVKIGTRTATPTVINDNTLTFAIPASAVTNKFSIVNANGEGPLSATNLTVS